jgi:hypothetical protein
MIIANGSDLRRKELQAERNYWNTVDPTGEHRRVADKINQPWMAAREREMEKLDRQHAKFLREQGEIATGRHPEFKRRMAAWRAKNRPQTGPGGDAGRFPKRENPYNPDTPAPQSPQDMNPYQHAPTNGFKKWSDNLDRLAQQKGFKGWRSLMFGGQEGAPQSRFQQAIAPQPPTHHMHKGIAPNMRMPIYDPRTGRVYR